MQFAQHFERSILTQPRNEPFLLCLLCAVVLQENIKRIVKEVDVLKGMKESDTGLGKLCQVVTTMCFVCVWSFTSLACHWTFEHLRVAAPSQWDLVADKQMMSEEQPLQVFYGSYIHPCFRSFLPPFITCDVFAFVLPFFGSLAVPKQLAQTPKTLSIFPISSR